MLLLYIKALLTMQLLFGYIVHAIAIKVLLTMVYLLLFITIQHFVHSPVELDRNVASSNNKRFIAFFYKTHHTDQISAGARAAPLKHFFY